MHSLSTDLSRRECCAAGYKRVSTADQANEGHSLDAQDDAITRFATQRGWKLARIYEDSGISGTRGIFWDTEYKARCSGTC